MNFSHLTQQKKEDEKSYRGYAKFVKSANDGVNSLLKTIGKYAKKPDTLDGLQKFLMNQKGILENVSKFLGPASLALTFLAATGALGPSEHEQVMNKLNEIEKSLGEMRGEMHAQFERTDAKISYSIKKM